MILKEFWYTKGPTVASETFDRFFEAENWWNQNFGRFTAAGRLVEVWHSPKAGPFTKVFSNEKAINKL